MRAVEAESGALLAAVASLLHEKGLVSPDEIRERIAFTGQASPALGARLVAKAWREPDFRALALRDGTAAAEAIGAFMRGAPPLGILENRPGLHHVVVCTLCSCYPRTVLGYPPGWYKSAAYRARAVYDPRGVLAEWGTEIPADTAIRVVDSTADYRWMVLPQRPAGTGDWSEEALAALVRAGIDAARRIRPPAARALPPGPRAILRVDGLEEGRGTVYAVARSSLSGVAAAPIRRAAAAAVSPPASWRAGSAPAASSRSTVASRSNMAATMSAVRPSGPHPSTAAPWSSSACTTSSAPLKQAAASAVCPRSLKRSASAPRASSAATVSRWP